MSRLLPLVSVAFLSGVVSAADVTVPSVPERWQLKEIGGEKLRSCFRTTGNWFDDLQKAPKMRMLDLAIPQFVSLKFLYLGKFKPEEKKWRKPTYTFEECMEDHWREAAEKFAKDYPGRPFFINLSPFDFRNPLELPESKPDVESFRRWIADKPGFMGFRGFSEFDNVYGMYLARTAYKDKPERQAALEQLFPIPDNWCERNVQIERFAALQNAAQFGCADRWDLNSLNCTFAQLHGKIGTKLLIYEAELCATSAPWRFGGLFTRGAARQWDTAWGWYMAHCVIGYSRDGRRQNAVNAWPNAAWPNARPFLGASRSLMRRNAAYGYLAGAATLEWEQWHYMFFEDPPRSTGTPSRSQIAEPSMYAKDFNAIFELNDRIDRGVPYTPFAFLVSIEEPFQRHGYNWANRDPYSQNAFFFTLVPTLESDPYKLSDRKNGKEGCLWNSEFGEIGDALCPDAGQQTEKFYEALRCYPAAILIGWFDKSRLDVAALMRYVKEGGRLYVTKKQVEDGLFPTEVEGKGQVVVVDNPVPQEFIDSPVKYWSGPDSKQTLIASGRQTFPVYQKVLREVQDEFMPVRVEGDIQWGCNRTKDGWLVWLINNKGVTKFQGEPQEFDKKACAHVTVTFKATNKVYTAVVGPGDYEIVEIKD